MPKNHTTVQTVSAAPAEDRALVMTPEGPRLISRDALEVLDMFAELPAELRLIAKRIFRELKALSDRYPDEGPEQAAALALWRKKTEREFFALAEERRYA